jgi:hypothetical protein
MNDHTLLLPTGANTVSSLKTVPLREVAHSRSGEKGNKSTISVIAYDEADYLLLEQQVTKEAVQRLYGPITKGSIERYEAPLIGALNFVLDEVLEGGRSRTLAFEESGKALSSLILSLPIWVPGEYVERSRGVRTSERDFENPSGPQPGKKVRLAAGAGWARDRFEPALDLVERGEIDYLCFDSMSEVTMSAAQTARMDHPDTRPFDPYLEERLAPILKECKRKKIRIITNQGWLDPHAAASQIISLAEQLGIADLRVAVVDGAILTDRIADLNLTVIETGCPVSENRERIVSAEAYLGAGGIRDALRQGADVVITTRIADGCLYLGPLAHEFDWDLDDFNLCARGMIIGHLMECGAQVSGGYFADPGFKEVPDLVDIGNPIVEVSEDAIVMTKLPRSGGLMSPATCKEQLLYEVEDPANYICPDCIADLTKVSFRQLSDNRVEVIIDHAGKPKTPFLKVLIGVFEGFLTEEMVIFAGFGALKRAQATEALLRERIRRIALDAQGIRFDYIGVNAVHREASPMPEVEPYEVVLRVAVKCTARVEAEKLRREIDPLAVNGVAATGKWATTSSGSRVRPVVGLDSCLVPRELVYPTVSLLTTTAETEAEFS